MPPFLPDNDAVRRDIAAQWTAWTRLDATLGALLGEVPLDDALVVLFSDNGIPFPSGKTNLAFEQGQREPLLISSPSQKTRGRRSDKVVGALDFFPTILDWVGLEYTFAARIFRGRRAAGGDSAETRRGDAVAVTRRFRGGKTRRRRGLRRGDSRSRPARASGTRKTRRPAAPPRR